MMDINNTISTSYFTNSDLYNWSANEATSVLTESKIQAITKMLTVMALLICKLP